MGANHQAATRRVTYRDVLWWIGIAFFTILLAWILPGTHQVFLDSYENAAYAIAPSPERAFAYGERHFNGEDPADYDINRASYFFNLAAAQDPSYPYLYHDIARI